LSYEKTDEELIASVASDVKAHFEKTKKEFEVKWNLKSHTSTYQKGAEEEGGRAQLEIARSSKASAKADYERQLKKGVKAQPTKKKAGKGVPQLRDTSRPLSPLIVVDQYGSNVGIV